MYMNFSSFFKHSVIVLGIYVSLISYGVVDLYGNKPGAPMGQAVRSLEGGAMLADNEKLFINDGVSVACENEVRCSDCNVILLSVDSLRADHVGAYGYERDTTPYFDALAKNNVLFENYFSTSFLTPVSEMTVHTGMYPSANMVTNFDTILPEDRLTIGQYFKEKGYATSALLSSPEFEINPALKESFSRGFSRYEYVVDHSGLMNSLRAFPSSEQVQKEIEIIENGKFFWWVALGGVHWPYGEQGQNSFADKNYNGFFKGKSLHWFDVFEKIFQGKHYALDVKLEESDIRYVRDQYDNGVRAFDEFLKMFIEMLEQKNLLHKTVIVIQSEHGEDLHEHGYFAHYDVLDTQTHVPLLIISPQFQTGCKIASFAGSADVFPTIVEMVGHEQFRQFQGRGLAPIMRGSEKNGARQEVFLERNPLWEETKAVAPGFQNIGMVVQDGKHKDIGIRTSRWKYIERTSKKTMEGINWWQTMSGKKLQFPEAELYDLVNDPGETANVIDRYPQEAAALKQKLQTWFTAVTANSKRNGNTSPAIQPYY